MKTETAFVAGATGFTGREVVRLLVERGARAIAHVRPDSERLEEWKSRWAAMGAEVDVTPWRPEALQQTLARIKPSMVFSLLGTTRKRMKLAAEKNDDPKNHDYMSVDYALTAMLLQAAVRSGAGPRFVYLSAAGAAPGRSSRFAYYRARNRAEHEITRSGLPYIIARPSNIAGPGRDDARPMERAGAAIFDALLAVAGMAAPRLAARYKSTTNVRLAHALVRLALDPDSPSRAYESEELAIDG